MIELDLNLGKIPYFCQALNQFESDFNIHNGRFIFDGKSLMGLYAINYNYDIFVDIIVKNEDYENIINNLQQFIKSSG